MQRHKWAATVRRCVLRLIFVCIVTAGPAVLAADSAPLTDSELHAAYCAGFHQARERYLGDVCFDAKAGWENECSADAREESRLLAELAAEQSIYKAGIGNAIVSGQNAFRQCINEATSDAGLAQASECKKHYAGQQLAMCTESGPAEPTCESLRGCDD